MASNTDEQDYADYQDFQKYQAGQTNAPPRNPVAAIGGTGPAAPGSSPDLPATGDLYGGHIDRLRASVGDPSGVAAMLKGRGYKAAQQNKNGEMVAQSPNDNKWYKDQGGLTHPLDWAESHAGSALPTVGMGAGAVLGGIGGAALGGPAAPATGYAGGVAGAGGGAAAGEAIRAALGKLAGTNQGDFAPQMADEAKSGALAEAIGAPVMKGLSMVPGVKQAGNAVADATIRPLLAKLSNMATYGGVDTAAAKRLLQRPDQVLSALDKGNVARVASAAGAERDATSSAMSDMSSQARKNFQTQFGATPVDTTPVVGAIEEAADRYAPNAYGESSMSPADRQELERRKISLGYPDIENGTGKTTVQSPLVDANGIPFSTTPPPAKASGPFSETAGSLQKTADDLQAQASGFYNKNDSKFSSDKGASTAASTAGKIKALLHQIDPNGLGAADKKFSSWADAAPAFDKVENPLNAESWAANLFGKNKTAAQNATQQYLPKSYEDLADIGAYKSFDSGDPLNKMFGPSVSAAPLLRTAGVLGGGSMVAHAAGDPMGALAGTALATAAAASSPALQRQMLGLTGRVINKKIPSMAIKTINPWDTTNQGEK